MKLKNKRTGEIIELKVAVNGDLAITKDDEIIGIYSSLAELNAEWEDYEEPKKYWYVDITCVAKPTQIFFSTEAIQTLKKCGNCFETKEEAEKAVEKLKAWKRLKDKKFRFTEWYKPDGCEPFIVIETNIDYDDVDNMELQKDLDLLFGGEE